MTKQRQTKTITKPEPEKCFSCGILIGQDFMERSAYQVGKFRICGHCIETMNKSGHVEIGSRHGSLCRWLYPDGSEKLMKLIVRMAELAHFEPYVGPVPSKFDEFHAEEQ